MSPSHKRSGRSTLISIMIVAAALLVAAAAFIMLPSRPTVPEPTAIDASAPGLEPAYTSALKPTTALDLPERRNPNLRVVRMSFDADKDHYVGPCPVTIKFSGIIKTKGGAGDLDYRLFRSDMTTQPLRRLHVDSTGAQTVSATWTIDSSDRFVGWQGIWVIGSSSGLVFRAPFIVECQRSSAAAAPQAALSSPGFRDVEASFDAEPENHTGGYYVGPCPVTIKLSATIKTKGGAGDITYSIRNRHADIPETGPSATWHFDSAGSMSVSRTLTLGAPGATLSEWPSFSALEGRPQPINPGFRFPDASVSLGSVPSLGWCADSGPTRLAPTRSAPARSNATAHVFHVAELNQQYGPSDYAGSCPVTIKFAADVKTAGGPGTVTFGYMRSDGVTQGMAGGIADAQGATGGWETTWVLGRPGVRDSGWLAFYVAHPGPLTSPRMKFRIRCNEQVASVPVKPWTSSDVSVLSTSLDPMTALGNAIYGPGPCPLTITFSAKIRGNEGTMTYRAIRSEGPPGPIETVQFESTEVKTVSDSWTIGTPGQKHAGSMSIEILTPKLGAPGVRVYAGPTKFTANCAP